ncbi:MAG: hypothetical protein ACP5K9_01400 [Candidatus Micrarchaeia archaeon]
MDYKRIALLTFFLAVLLVNVSKAQLCSNLYSIPSQMGNGNAQYITDSSTYTGMLDIALLIILAVLSVMGIAYAIGYSMRIDSITNYVKREIAEQAANILIIATIIGSTAIAFNGIVFVMQIANFGMSSLSTASTSSITISPLVMPSSTLEFYTSICNNFAGYFYTFLGNAIGGLIQLELLNAVSGLSLNIMPNNFGISMMPLNGMTPISIVFSSLFFVSITLYVLTLLMVFLTFIIYFLFPIFLYLGVILRAFPWTRAAGGAFLALFISFYIIFPALVYPFSLISINVNNALTGAISFFGGVASLFTSFGFSIFNLMIGGFVGAMVASYSFALIGISIAFIIAYDSLEAFAQLLGAPAFRGRGGSIFQKLI